MAQPDGSYPRLNGALLGSGNFEGQIVSLVGQFGGDPQHQFLCCDNVTVQIDTQQAEGMHMPAGTIAEIVGQVALPTSVVVFVVRELSPDTDLEIYNKMLAVQHNPKFAHYFAAAADGMMAH